MIKLIYFRAEDYWLLVVSGFAILFTGMFFYAGALQLRLISALLGLSGLLFTMYIIRRSYSTRRSYAHLAFCLLASAALAFSAHLLTN